MKRTRIKFCGITRAADADTAARLGADAIGLVLAPGSPRFISPQQAAIIRARMLAPVQVVTLFSNAAASVVRDALEEVQPDLLQFHGDESPQYCASFGRPYWRAVPMGSAVDLGEWERRFSTATALLLDAHGAGGQGGQGRAFDWTATRATRPYVLAGGLTPDNVGEAVRRLRPSMVDVSSGIESAPGIKDEDKMQRFVEAVRKADGQ